MFLMKIFCYIFEVLPSPKTIKMSKLSNKINDHFYSTLLSLSITLVNLNTFTSTIQLTIKPGTAILLRGGINTDFTIKLKPH